MLRSVLKLKNRIHLLLTLCENLHSMFCLASLTNSNSIVTNI